MENRLKIELEYSKEELEIFKNTLEVEILVLQEDIKKAIPCTKMGHMVLGALRVELKIKQDMLSKISTQLESIVRITNTMSL